MTCKLANLGDPSMPIVLDVIALDVAGTSLPVNNGDSVALISPPQGGRVVFIGAHATNLSPCGVTIDGSLEDPATGAAMLDKRTTNLHPLGDGYGVSLDANIATFSNVAACPNQWSSQDVFDQPYELTLTLTDKAGRTASKTISVIPRCAEPGTLATTCMCICKKGYVLGSACP